MDKNFTTSVVGELEAKRFIKYLKATHFKPHQWVLIWLVHHILWWRVSMLSAQLLETEVGCLPVTLSELEVHKCGQHVVGSFGDHGWVCLDCVSTKALIISGSKACDSGINLQSSSNL